MQKVEKRFAAILKRFPDKKLVSVKLIQKVREKKKKRRTLLGLSILLAATLSVLTLGASVFFNYINGEECLLDLPFDPTKAFRDPESCDMCKGLTQVDKIHNITSSDFDAAYASPARPVVVTDATRDWPALKTFSFDFFRELYLSTSPSQRPSCQFFPYKTNFESLREALNMSASRASLAPGEAPWYVGWSNCDDDAGKKLREYYETPYFLPDTSEGMALAWIFMGGPGRGAHLHVDNVRYPSWQAQIRGRKKWRLAPPPECYFACQELKVIVEPGEIIVVDTNRWYHETEVLPGGISITIGAEFD